MTSKTDQTKEVKRALADPRKLAAALSLVDSHSEKQARGIIVRCPAHEDKGRANLSITTGKDGTARAKCHACGFTGDALTLIAVVHGLDMREDFKKILLLGAEMSGQHQLAAELDDGKPRPDRIPVPEARQLPEPTWPNHIQNVWDSCTSVLECPKSVAQIVSRGIAPEEVAVRRLAKSLPCSGALPPWARFGRRTWRHTGHVMLVRAWDSSGILRSVRAWRCADTDTPKRLPPAGCRAAGLVLADRLGWGLLNGSADPRTLLIVEGEPDWLASSIAAPGGFAVWGIGSGSWTQGFADVASKVSRVIVATHPDNAGDRYAAEVMSGVKKAQRWRPQKDLDELFPELQALIGAANKWLFTPHQLGD